MRPPARNPPALAMLAMLASVLGARSALAAPRARKPATTKPAAPTAEQKAADRHFRSGVALFKEAKYAEALAEFERAYEIAPHPLVLYNIAGCHRELSHYGEAVSYYGRFLVDAKDKVPAARIAAARVELDGILTRIARVTVKIALPIERSEDMAGDPTGSAGAAGDNAPGGLAGVSLVLDGAPLDNPDMPLILAPGEHRLLARAAGHRDAERNLRLASGDDITVELSLPELPPPAPVAPPVVERGPAVPAAALAPPRRRFAVGGGFGTNLRRAADSGAPSLGASGALGSRLEVGVDLVLVAYAVVPSLSVRVAGDELSLHAVGAMPIVFPDDSMSGMFAAGALGLGLRYRPTPSFAVRLDSFASFAGSAHGVTVPTFLRGELWF